MSAQETSLTSGSALAAQRETDRISFETLFRRGGVEDMGIVETYLSNLVEMANSTPFLYGDLTAMSKTLATYGYSAQADQAKTLSGEKDYNYILDVLETIGDAGAALGQTTGDMEAMATAIGRMKSSNKATLEYLNILNDRGIGAVGMLAEARGVDQGTMYDMISKGQVSGQEAAEIILQAMTDSFSGSMLAQSRTFSGLTSTVEGLSQELDNAMGQGYNEGRMKGLTAQRDWLSGESGEAVMEANKAIGAWKAELENSKEQYIRDAVDAMMKTEEYRTAQDTGDAAEMGRLIMEAKVQGMNEYNASEGAQLALESEKSLVEAIRSDTSLDSDYWDAGYEKGQWFTKGLAAAMGEGKYFVKADIDQETGLTVYTDSYGFAADSMLVDPGGAGGLRKPGYAYGLDYVPYDNFPALLHQGERVQTAAEARGERVAPSVTITGNNFTIREEADVTRVASELLAQMELAGMRG
nr:tape measure protein [uncultured Oscillibacter sp.]